ncbi:hypothetical protein GGD38_000809 [Chitinophagaceae bacterium OAS944]|nr:hypothetical protein [Chitinophagaceae bacterium OAS944]
MRGLEPDRVIIYLTNVIVKLLFDKLAGDLLIAFDIFKCVYT